ncbi:hypothetical protein G9A89_016298 [Geosiphon pyriformis]|nr:hypothetical protein G9A89_016298 [Geosiphon pyriformis]
MPRYGSMMLKRPSWPMDRTTQELSKPFPIFFKIPLIYVPQILNQFIRGLYSSILQRVCPMHPADFQAAVMNARDFEATKLEANHAQTIAKLIALPAPGLLQLIELQRLPSPITTPSAPLVKFEEEKKKSIWKAYQMSWTDKDHNELPSILSWDNNGKRKQNKTKLTWNAN